MKMHFKFSILIAVTLFFLATSLVYGQDQRDTGRHKPQPVPVKTEPAPKQTLAKRGQLFLGFNVGASRGSGLFQCSTISGNAVPWATVGGSSFNSSHFSTKLHYNLMVGLSARYSYSPGKHNGSAIRFGMDYSNIEILAQTLAGQVGALVLYDQTSIINLSLGWEYPMVDLASYPYLGAEVLMSYFSPTMATDLEQTNFGGRFVFGYHYQFHKQIGIRLGGRLSRTGWGMGEFAPQSTLDNQPPIKLSGENHVTYFDFLVGVELKM